MNPPAALVVGVAGVNVTALPLNVWALMLLVPANPVPVTVTTSPTFPDTSDTLIFDCTVNNAVALFVEASVTETVFAPAVLAGTTNVPEKPPDALLEAAPVKVIAPPANVGVNALEPANPVPVTVTTSPTFPDTSDKLIFGCTVNDAVALLPDASVIETVLAP